MGEEAKVNWPEWTSPDGRIRLICADCLEVRDSLSPVDAVISDPPYGMANDCDYTRFTMGPNGHGKASSRFYESVIGDDQPFDPSPWLDYERVVMFGSNHFAARLPVGTTLVWIKRFDGGFGSFLSDAEVAWMKGGHGVYCHRDTSLFGETNKRAHPTQKPIGLMAWCMERAKVPDDGLVLDPFAGSCTTAIACIRTNRRCIAIERERKYWEIGIERCKAEYARTVLFDRAEVVA